MNPSRLRPYIVPLVSLEHITQTNIAKENRGQKNLSGFFNSQSLTVAIKLKSNLFGGDC